MSTLSALHSPSSPQGDDTPSQAPLGSGGENVSEVRPSPISGTHVHGDSRGQSSHDRWPLYPFGFDREEMTPPNATLLEVVREFVPEFDPENDPLAWKSLGEFVRVWSRRSAEDMAAMTQDGVIAVLRACRVWYRGPQSQLVGERVGGKRRAARKGGRRPGQSAATEDTVDVRLQQFTRERPLDAVEFSLRELGHEIGCTKGAFARSRFYKQQLNPLRTKRTRRATGAERFGAEDLQAIRNNDEAQADKDAADERLDAEMASRSRPK